MLHGAGRWQRPIYLVLGALQGKVMQSRAQTLKQIPGGQWGPELKLDSSSPK